MIVSRKEKAIIQPPFLKAGDVIGITCPAGYMPSANIQECVQALQKWGYEVMVGKTVGSKSENYFSGSDEERAAELQAMLDAPEIRAVLCGRGGYGTSRIIDTLDFRAFKKNPKWIIGFSDITVLHAHLNRQLRIASLHAPMAAAFMHGGVRGKYVRSLEETLHGKPAHYRVKKHKLNRSGQASGELIGGNLALMAHLIGSPSFPRTEGKILFIEDVGEQLYNIDRMLLQLRRSGMLEHLAGLIVGGFTEMKDTVRPFGKKVYPIIKELIEPYSFPVCFGFPVSHEKTNLTMKVGGYFNLRINSAGVFLREIKQLPS